MDLFLTLLVLADGRGDNPTLGGGLAVVIGIAVLFLIGGLLFHLIAHKGFLRNRGSASQPDEHRPGRVGRL